LVQPKTLIVMSVIRQYIENIQARRNAGEMSIVLEEKIIIELGYN